MKKTTNLFSVLLAILLFTGLHSVAQTTAVSVPAVKEMHTYVIERNIPGAGEFTPEKLKTISQKSCSVLKDMGPGIQWLQSYVTGNKIFCIYKAENEEMLREHAQKGGFPINAVYEVSSVISPATASN